ncbi:aldehyde dehydrogenase family protein [Arsenicitalea aurantiaca]|uniref:Aldehyde dehydrogenase family protein n=1 Tax=Arsenicitalea aurantiaca TaxID=1783274 RepID=A0A433XKT7_9HYPH|nr:aldehyde dehydrogenase family protein [Arsenicitalea aurantiaca]RUT34689.1 aldehyde dehydrogenase family protein [Arsenicitalea aurantiaca]
MGNALRFYIDGSWVDPVSPTSLEVTNPADETLAGTISLGSGADVDRAVIAARRAFEHFGFGPKAERVSLLRRIVEVYERRYEEIAEAITLEMGSPISFSRSVQAHFGRERFKQAADLLEAYDLEHMVASSRIIREPIGVCGFITPWNWPMNQIASKVAYGLAAGCTIVWKPSEISPLSAIILTEIIEEAGAPAGVFNMIQGDGPGVGAALASHPDIDMISFTGSTRAGVMVAKAAADTVKRVHQELGGKSANIILPDADLETAVRDGVLRCFTNTGQSCQAPTRLLVQEDQLAAAVEIARKAALSVRIGHPSDPETKMGPLVSAMQFARVQEMIEAGIAEGATLVAGGPGRPKGFDKGYYVSPTVFSDVRNDMRIAREEIFGPVVVIIAYRDEDEAIAIANDSEYGLAGYIASRDVERARRIARRIRAGRIYINMAPPRGDVPFGGYKKSGNGREQGVFGFEDFLEVKAVLGYEPA